MTRHIEQYLGLDKRKDLTQSLKNLRLIEIKDLVQSVVAKSWFRALATPGQRCSLSALARTPLSCMLLNTKYNSETEPAGDRKLILSRRFGIYSYGPVTCHASFLTQRDYRRFIAFYQYGTLPQSLLTEVMSNWQQHEGAVRLLLWLLFKLRLGGRPAGHHSHSAAGGLW